MSARLVLGTAQFGLDYGIVNRHGKLPAGEVRDILALARRSEIDCIDTAAAYGDAEDVLGRSGLSGFKIVSKVPPLGDANPGRAIAESGRRSIARTGCGKLHGLLLHDARDLTGPRGPEVYAGLLAARESGIADRIGVSVYEPSEIEMVLERYPVDLVQCPLSIVDRRCGAWISRLSAHGTAVHVRSVFLQGLLLQDPVALPERFRALAPALAALHDRLPALGTSALGAALAFARDWPGVEGVVVGVTSLEEFGAIVTAFRHSPGIAAGDLAADLAADLAVDDDLLDPRRWPKN